MMVYNVSTHEVLEFLIESIPTVPLDHAMQTQIALKDEFQAMALLCHGCLAACGFYRFYPNGLPKPITAEVNHGSTVRKCIFTQPSNDSLFIYQMREARSEYFIYRTDPPTAKEVMVAIRKDGLPQIEITVIGTNRAEPCSISYEIAADFVRKLPEGKRLELHAKIGSAFTASFLRPLAEEEKERFMQQIQGMFLEDTLQKVISDIVKIIRPDEASLAKAARDKAARDKAARDQALRAYQTRKAPETTQDATRYEQCHPPTTAPELAQPRLFDDSMQVPPRRSGPTVDFPPPDFEDEYQMNRQRGNFMGVASRSPFNIGYDDLNPQGLGPRDPFRPSFVGGGGPLGSTGGGGMHPTFNDPLFQNNFPSDGRVITRYDPQVPPGARYDPVGPGDMQPRGSGGRNPLEGRPLAGRLDRTQQPWGTDDDLARPRGSPFGNFPGPSGRGAQGGFGRGGFGGGGFGGGYSGGII